MLLVLCVALWQLTVGLFCSMCVVVLFNVLSCLLSYNCLLCLVELVWHGDHH